GGDEGCSSSESRLSSRHRDLHLAIPPWTEQAIVERYQDRPPPIAPRGPASRVTQATVVALVDWRVKVRARSTRNSKFPALRVKEHRAKGGLMNDRIVSIEREAAIAVVRFDR